LPVVAENSFGGGEDHPLHALEGRLIHYQAGALIIGLFEICPPERPEMRISRKVVKVIDSPNRSLNLILVEHGTLNKFHLRIGKRRLTQIQYPNRITCLKQLPNQVAADKARPSRNQSSVS